MAGPSPGQLTGIDHDCNDIPDAAMTLAVAALFAEGPTAIRNVYNWRVKETERMVAIVTELRKLGAQVLHWLPIVATSPPWTPGYCADCCLGSAPGGYGCVVERPHLHVLTESSLQRCCYGCYWHGLGSPLPPLEKFLTTCCC